MRKINYYFSLVCDYLVARLKERRWVCANLCVTVKPCQGSVSMSHNKDCFISTWKWWHYECVDYWYVMAAINLSEHRPLLAEGESVTHHVFLPVWKCWLSAALKKKPRHTNAEGILQDGWQFFLCYIISLEWYINKHQPWKLHYESSSHCQGNLIIFLQIKHLV